MMKTIYKYEINPFQSSTQMPVGAKILTVQGQHQKICVWAEVDDQAEMESVVLQIYGTGHRLPEDADHEYIGTGQSDGGAFVFHVYKEKG